MIGFSKVSEPSCYWLCWFAGRNVSVVAEVERFLYRIIMMMEVYHMSLSSIPCSITTDLADLKTTHELRRLGSHYPAFVDTAGLEGSECTSHQPFVNQQRRSWNCYGT